MASVLQGKRIGILVGGGPAPGINGVISSVTIEAIITHGMTVIGFQNGFRHLVEGSTTQNRELSIEEVAASYLRGGSILGTARTNPAKKEADMAKVLGVLEKMKIDCLVTIGGDDTAFSGSQVARRVGPWVEEKTQPPIRVCHVPKTIDNDLPLPEGTPTFGFETARHYGTLTTRALHADAKTTSRWYIVISMGRAAGHLALGIGKASASTLTVIPEEFRKTEVTLEGVTDLIIGSILKRKLLGKEFGVAVLAEGLIESIGEKGLVSALGDDLQHYGRIERDDHGHLRLGELEFGRIIKDFLKRRLKEIGLKGDFIDKDLGYELRSADPIPFDAEYTRDLGYGAMRFLESDLATQCGAIISFVDGKMIPLPFIEMIDPKTQRMKPRKVNVDSESFLCAKRYMVRLQPGDLTNPATLKELAKFTNLSPEALKERFTPVANM
jgi:6-phosphofructokinase 1